MTLRIRRAATALAASAALIASPALVQGAQAAEAAPKPPTKQLLKDIAGKDSRLDRISTSNRLTRLADDHEAGVVANITADRDTLAGLKTVAESLTTVAEARELRKELRSLRVENYVLAIGVVRQAENLTEAAASDPEATAHLGLALEGALDITIESKKADVKAARAHLKEAREELEGSEA